MLRLGPNTLRVFFQIVNNHLGLIIMFFWQELTVKAIGGLKILGELVGVSKDTFYFWVVTVVEYAIFQGVFLIFDRTNIYC